MAGIFYKTHLWRNWLPHCLGFFVLWTEVVLEESLKTAGVALVWLLPVVHSSKNLLYVLFCHKVVIGIPHVVRGSQTPWKYLSELHTLPQLLRMYLISSGFLISVCWERSAETRGSCERQKASLHSGGSSSPGSLFILSPALPGSRSRRDHYLGLTQNHLWPARAPKTARRGL